MLASRLPGILPTMNEEEALEAASVQSLGTQGFYWSSGAKGLSGRRTILHQPLRWLAEVQTHGLAKSVWRIMACCFWMSCQSSSARYWKYCVNLWSPK
jgi:hypothetical protein